jgi:hypothetical protein
VKPDSVSSRRKKRILSAIAVAAALALIHYAIRKYIPSFSVLHDRSPRPWWIPITIDAEFLLHLSYFGALVSLTGESIPSLSKPKYSDDGTESIFNTGPHIEEIDWSSIAAAWACVPVYVLLWMLAYGYL